MELQFKCTVLRFGQQGEKTGWTYIEIPASIAQQLMPGNKKTFRVKGRLDDVAFEGVALLPMGDGNFIMALNAQLRKQLGKRKGASLDIQISLDESPVMINEDLIGCLADEPEANSFFNSLTKGHQKYFSNWINTARTVETKSKRIAETLSALSKKQDFGQMLRALTIRNKETRS
ncbi:MAG: YdeI/OmpD-associated family protein [Ginsengibacter sp.]